MLGKGVKLGDVMVAIAIVLPVSALVGALLGFYSNRFGLSGGLRLAIIVAFTSLAGQIARTVVTRRVKARSTPPARQG